MRLISLCKRQYNSQAMVYHCSPLLLRHRRPLHWGQGRLQEALQAGRARLWAHRGNQGGVRHLRGQGSQAVTSHPGASHSSGLCSDYRRVFLLKGDFLYFFLFYVRYSTLFHLPPLRFHCVEDAGIEPRTVAITALTVRRSNHPARSHPLSARYHPLSAKSHPHSARSHPLGISGP